MKKFLICLFFLSLAIPFKIQALADGPDYWQVKPGVVVNLHAQPDLKSSIIKNIPAGTSAIKSLGCQGGPSFEEWSQMSPEQQKASKDSIWCKLEFQNQTGWVQNKYLQEGSLTPSFDCAKATGEIETLICQTPSLAALDQQMSKTYQAALEAQKKEANYEASLKELKAIQRGWVKGRNDCWKDQSKTDCVKNEYERRISWLQVRYALVSGAAPVWYFCNHNPKDEIVATFFKTQVPTVRLERGDRVQIAMLGPSGSGSRYLGDFGMSFWIKGNEAMVEWPQGTKFNCQVRK